MQFLKFFWLLQKCGLSYAIFKNLDYHIHFPFKKMGYHMQFQKFLYILLKHGLSYAIFEISSSYPKTLTIICNFWNIFPFSKNMDYHVQFLELLYAIIGIY